MPVIGKKNFETVVCNQQEKKTNLICMDAKLKPEMDWIVHYFEGYPKTLIDYFML